MAVSIGIDSDDVGRDIALSGSGNQNLLRTRLDVLTGPFPVDKHASALDDDVDAESLPWQISRVAVSDDLDYLSVDGNGAVAGGLDVGVEDAECGVVLEEVRGLLDAAGVVDGNHIEWGILATVPAT